MVLILGTGLASVSEGQGKPTDAPSHPAVGVARAGRALYLDDASALDAALETCGDGDEQALVRCLIQRRFASDPRAGELALALFDTQGTVVGVEPADVRKVGYRGVVKFVPTLPVGREGRKHLRWIVAALQDIDRVMTELRGRAAAPLPTRTRGLLLLFTSTPGRRTPSAYAWNWTVTYNLRGSLHRSGRAVRETLFHELFHLNDQAHKDWSDRALGSLFDRIVAKCTMNGKLSTSCLRPYAPGKTKVRHGTYYAFQPGNGVGEYAAELALRVFIEQRAALSGHRATRHPFKCGPADNAQAWKLLIDEFFGGVDLVKCPD